MKNVIIAFSIVVFFMIGQIVQAQNAASLNEKEQSEIQYMVEAEKMARDVFVVLNEKWDHTIFAHIGNAEQRHLDKMKALANQYDLTIPVTVLEDKPGAFQNADLQKLYGELIIAGSMSLADAFRVGAQIEELDIKQLRTAMDNTENENILKVYQQLEQAAQKHLQSFTKNIEVNGISYQPVLLSQSEYDAIVKAEPSCKGKSEMNGAACCSAKKGNKAEPKSSACCSRTKNKGAEKGNCGSNKKGGKKKGGACCSSKS